MGRVGARLRHCRWRSIVLTLSHLRLVFRHGHCWCLDIGVWLNPLTSRSDVVLIYSTVIADVLQDGRRRVAGFLRVIIAPIRLLSCFRGIDRGWEPSKVSGTHLPTYHSLRLTRKTWQGYCSPGQLLAVTRLSDWVWVSHTFVISDSAVKQILLSMNERNPFIIEDLDDFHLVIKADEEYRVRIELEAEVRRACSGSI